MQRIVLLSQRFGCATSRLLSGARTLQTGQIFRSAHNEGPIATAADIKKNVPELWVRKMKTFFAFYDKNSDGVVNNKDYKIFMEDICVSNAVAKNVSKEQIEEFKTKMDKLWIDEANGGNENFEWTENKYLELMFALVNRPGTEEFFRHAATEMFKLFDLNGDGSISKDELKAVLGGSPWSIVSFAGMDTNRNGEVSLEEYVQTNVDFLVQLC